MKLYFVRHGESEANTRHIISNRESQFSLTSRGREQASALAERLQKIRFTAMFCSPVLRARETAHLLSASLGVAYQVTEALREYDCGVLEERGDEESWRSHRYYFDNWTLHKDYPNKPQGGESFMDIQKRFVPFVEDLTCNSLYKNENILLVGHGGLFLLMMPLILSNIENEFVQEHGIGHTECIVAESISHGLICRQWGTKQF